MQKRQTNMLSLSTAAVTVLGLCLGGAAADGSVVGSAQPGTMAGTFTVPFSEFESTTASGCSTSFAGCTGEFLTKEHEVAGIVTVIDDCTFRIQGWQFDGLGPAVEWYECLTTRRHNASDIALLLMARDFKGQ